MNYKIYIDNLAPATSENELEVLFSAYGNVADVNIVVERTDQKLRGFGYLTMVTREGARAAVQALNGMRIREHTLRVSETGPYKQHTGLVKVASKSTLEPSSLP
ncbi:MAG TPA: RNA-binding protein [Verrucomicrobiae bacterium]|nr:RNA-binding protein [Verrucomicrobiae bacterium]